MRYLIAFLLSLSFCGFVGNFSSYNDNKTYVTDLEARYLIIDPVYELSIGASEKSLVSGKIKAVGVNYDYMPNEKLSPFFFASLVDNEISAVSSFRNGVGIAWLYSESVLSFPYRNKLSFAVVADNNRKHLVGSFRWKVKGYFEKVGFESTLFLLGYSETVDVRLSYKLGKNVDLLNKYYYERYEEKKYNSNAIGIEIKF